MSITESNVTYLRMQDTGRPSDYSGTNNGCGGCSLANPSNRKIVFAHDMTAEGAPDTVLDDGFTLTFRARIPTPSNTTAPLDPLYPNGEGANGPQPYPAGGDGFLIADNAYGYFTVRQLAGGKIAFSLTVSNDTAGGLLTTPRASYQGLSMNGLNGTSLNNTVDFGEAPAQFLSLDPTEWNECWIVLRKDDSGLGTHVVFIYTNGSLSPQIFHLTAASAGETVYNSMSFFALAMSTTAQMGAVDIDFVAYKFSAVFPPGAGGLPPTISGVAPTPPPQGNVFWPVTNGISFTASSSGSSTIPSSGVLLFLNGVNVSSNLNITGPNTNLTVAYSGLVENRIYTGRIVVTDSGGQSATFPLLFDTFSEAGTVVIEAEDYNHSNGQFLDNPAPNGYSSFTGTPEVDFHDATPSTGDYRGDAVDTRLSTDTARPQFGASDFDGSLVEQGEWMNYTRTYPFLPSVANYDVYLRYASQVAQPIRLDLVTGDQTRSNQSTSVLGTFAATNNGAAHTYAKLSDAFGNPLTVNLAGVETLRLTTPEASINLQLNYLVLVPVGASVNPPVAAFASPGPNSINMLPDAPIQIAIVDRDLGVAPASIKLQFDGNDVTGAATVTSNALGALIIYQPPNQLVLNSTHTNRLVFSDERTSPQTYTNQWTFKVANLPVLLAAWATAPGSGLTNGCNVHIHKARNGAQNLLFPNTSIRAENQLANLLNDADTGQPFVNEAAGPNGNGLFSETVINYSQGGTDQGLFSGDQQFPYINPADYADDPNHIAMAATAYLELSAGLHRFGVRRDDGFKLAAGPDFTANGAALVLGAFEPVGGAESSTAATEFDFMVATNGVYPVRLVFFENSGAADIEWYSVNRATGVATLINDPSDSNSVKAYLSRSSPVTNPQILNPTVAGGNFQFSYATVVGRRYFVEYKDSLSDVSWQSQPGIDGDGSTMFFGAAANAAATRFYRIRAE